MMHARLPALTTALATTAVLAAAAAGSAAALPWLSSASSPGASVAQRPGVSLGPLEVVDSYASPVAGAWYWPSTTVADQSGVVTATWSDRGVQVAQRAADGTWGAPTRLFSCADPDACDYGGARLSVDGSGTVTAVWNATTPRQGVYYSIHRPGGTWSTAALVSGKDRRAGGEIDIASARDGTTVLAYTAYMPGKGWDVVTRYRPSGASWGQARKHVFLHAATVRVGISRTGKVVLGVNSQASSSSLRTYRYRPGHGWSRPVVHGAAYYDSWDLAVDARGRAVLAWDSALGSVQVLRARTMTKRGYWTARTVLTRKPLGTGPYVAIHARATVLWSPYSGSLKSATRVPGHLWQLSTPYPKHTGSLRDVATNSRGDLAVLWEHWTDPMPRLVAGLRLAGRWTATVQVPARYVGENAGANGLAAVLPDGSAVVITNDTDADPNTWPTGPAVLRILARHVSPTP